MLTFHKGRIMGLHTEKGRVMFYAIFREELGPNGLNCWW